MKAGFCHYHNYTLTFRQMRNHKCLQKKDGWCKRFEPNIEHPWWQERFRRRSKEVGRPFIEKMERGEPHGFTADEWCRDTFGENDGK